MNIRISTSGVARRGEKYLLALRRPGTSIGESWEFPGGKVKEGESPEDALKREFREELQINVLIGNLLCTGNFENRNNEYEIRAFDVRILGDGFTLSEHQNTGWFSLHEMQRLPMADSDKKIVNCLRRMEDTKEEEQKKGEE